MMSIKVLPLLVLACVSFGSPAVSQTPQQISADARLQLAPNGKIRAAINVSNIVLAQKDLAGGAPRGITVDLDRELARRAYLPLELVVFESAGRVTDALKSGAWDIAFLAIEPARAAEIDFTAPYVLIEGAYMVSKESPLQTVGDVDRAGIRIAVGRGSAYDLYLSRTLKNASLVRYSTGDLAVQQFLADKLDVVAGVKQPLVLFAKSNPAVRMIDGRFQLIEQAMGTPKGRSAAATYLRSFVEDAKASGFVAAALERSNQPDAVVAPTSK